MHSIRRYNSKHDRRAVRIRGKIAASARPRLSIHRSNKYIFAQVILPTGVSTCGIRGKDGKEVGVALAKKALAAGITAVVFDRGGYRYHGQVKMLADAAREGGLKF